MKKIGHFLKSRSLQKKQPLDEGSMAYIFYKVIRSEYGNRGAEVFRIGSVKERKLFVKAENSNWASEISSNKDSFLKKLNYELGGHEIEDIAIG